MSYDNEIEENIGGTLVDQVGSEPRFLARGLYDMRKLGIIRSSKDNPDLYFPTVFGFAVKDIIENNTPFIIAWPNAAVYCSVSVRGGGIATLIKAEQVKKTGMVQYEAEVAEPSRMDKLLRRANVQQYEQQERDRLEL